MAKKRSTKESAAPVELERPYSSAMPEAILLLFTAVSIIFFGLTVLYSTSFAVHGVSFFTKQVIWMLVGSCGAFATVVLGYRWLSDHSWLWMTGCSILLVWAMLSAPIKGANRWVSVAGMTIQPSEFTKVALVLFLAWFLSNRTRDMENAPFLRVLLPVGLLCGPVILLVLLGKDLGTTALLVAVFFAVLFVAGLRLRYILPFVLVLPTLVFFLIMQYNPERASRLTSFLDPESCQMADGYQLWNSFLALGSGNWHGIGFTESRLKLKYLPEAHTDFILSIVGEELGFIAVGSVIMAYLLFAFFGVRIGTKARTRQGMLVAFGMVAFITMQAIINMGVICGAFPTKGMPAPMISYGGSTLVSCMLAVGCIFSVALDNSYPKYDELLREKWLGWLDKQKKKKKA